MLDRVLYACFELGIAPPAYNFFNFLVLADMTREEMGLDEVHVVFVPGEADGFRAEDIEYPAVNKQWRLRQICIAGACLLPSCTGHTLCASRADAAALLEARATHIFPAGYRVDAPRADHNSIRLVRAARDGRRVDRLQAPAQARIYVRKWLQRVAGERRVVSITLRESNYDVHRSSTLDNWRSFAAEIAGQGFCPVFVRDTERVFDGDTDALAGFAALPEAAVNIELRAALYAEAWLNTGINQGPWTLWQLLRDVPYLCVYVIDRMYDGWADYHVGQGTGFVAGQDLPFARGCQVTYWGDDHAEDLSREFWKLAARLDAGEHQRDTEAASQVQEESQLDLARRYLGTGQHQHALAICEAVLAEDPDDLQAVLHAGLASFHGGDHGAAIARLEPVVELLGPEAAVVDILVQARAARGQLDAADALLGQALARSPDDPVLHERRGDLAMQRGQVSDGVAAYRRALEGAPEAAGLMQKLADASFAGGDVQAAISCYVGVAKRGVISLEMVEGLARALQAAGHTEQSAVLHRMCVELRSSTQPELDPLIDVLQQHWEAAA